MVYNYTFKSKIGTQSIKVKFKYRYIGYQKTGIQIHKLKNKCMNDMSFTYTLEKFRPNYYIVIDKPVT